MKSDRVKKISALGIILHVILIIVTVGLSASLILSYAATYINPNDYWTLSFFGLVAPFLFLGNILLLLYWIMKWRFWALLPFITLLFGLGHLSALVQIPFGQEYGNQEDSESDVRVMSYNVQGFMSQSPDGNYTTAINQIVTEIDSLQPDIICFQEYYSGYDRDHYVMDSLLSDWSYNDKSFTIPNFGIAIYSKYRILDSQHIIYDSTSNSSMWVDLLINKDTVRVFNNHLQSNQIDRHNVEYIENIKNDSPSTTLIKELSAKLRDNYKRRATQVDSVSQIINSTKHPVIVCGDFNDTPVSYTYRKMRNDLIDTFIAKGVGFHYTYNGLFKMLRIDYIFCSDNFEVVEYKSLPLPYSDHNPVMSVLRLVE